MREKQTIIESEAILEDFQDLGRIDSDHNCQVEEDVFIEGEMICGLLDFGATYVVGSGSGPVAQHCPPRLKTLERDRFKIHDVRLVEKASQWFWSVTYKDEEMY